MDEDALLLCHRFQNNIDRYLTTPVFRIHLDIQLNRSYSDCVDVHIDFEKTSLPSMS